uniref:PIN-like protein n=1 Tax=Ditylenchus dipsaci TaxID=166011 RepID=A0A915CP80_9BILA
MWDLFFIAFPVCADWLAHGLFNLYMDLFGQSLTILVIGLTARVVIVFLISMCTNLKVKEQCFLSLSFMPKANTQAALGPILVQYYMTDSNIASYVQLVLQTCLLSILFTAPLGQMLIQISLVFILLNILGQ